MSYDLVVFEKTKVPTNPTEFLSWYQKQVEWNEDCDYNGSSHVSEKLQKFFHKIKDIFPPMNGPLSPNNKELSENPDLEERLCDYCIGKDLIHLSLAYSISGHAYDTVKRAAYFSGVGFFAPSTDKIPYFFASRYPMLLEGEWFRPLWVSDFESIREKLNEMTVKNRSFMYITDQIGSYIQVGGYNKSYNENSFTVEKRIYTDIMTYTHEKAEYSSNTETDETDYVLIAGNRVQVKKYQILSKDVVEQLFNDFFQGTATTNAIQWTKLFSD